MNIKDKKFIVTTGCSYGRMADFVFVKDNFYDRSVFNRYGKNWIDSSHDLVVLNVSLGSHGSDWQCDSIIYTVNKLFELGVKSEDIYVFVEWSQWHRYTVSQHHYTEMDFSELGWESENKRDFPIYFIDHKDNNNNGETNEVSKFFKKFLNLKRSDTFENIGKINERIYITPSHLDGVRFRNINSTYKFYYENCIKIENVTPIESKIKTYLNNILRLQYFLKSNQVKYDYCFMQVSLSHWTKREDGLIIEPLINLGDFMYRENYDAKFNEDYNPKNQNNQNIENVMPENRNEILQLDFNNIWFYENERYSRGGLDEYTIDNFKEGGFLNINHSKNFDLNNIGLLDIIIRHGEHPASITYITLWNEIAKNCNFMRLKDDYVQFMLDRYWEDYNSNEKTINNLTISKKHWYEILNKKGGMSLL